MVFRIFIGNPNEKLKSVEVMVLNLPYDKASYEIIDNGTRMLKVLPFDVIKLCKI